MYRKFSTFASVSVLLTLAALLATPVVTTAQAPKDKKEEKKEAKKVEEPKIVKVELPYDLVIPEIKIKSGKLMAGAIPAADWTVPPGTKSADDIELLGPPTYEALKETPECLYLPEATLPAKLLIRKKSVLILEESEAKKLPKPAKYFGASELKPGKEPTNGQLYVESVRNQRKANEAISEVADLKNAIKVLGEQLEAAKTKSSDDVTALRNELAQAEARLKTYTDTEVGKVDSKVAGKLATLEAELNKFKSPPPATQVWGDCGSRTTYMGWEYVRGTLQYCQNGVYYYEYRRDRPVAAKS